MRLQDYLKENNVEDSVSAIVKVEFKAMTLVDMDKYSEEIQRRCKKRIEELTIYKIIDDFFYEARDKEGQLVSMDCTYGPIPSYINIYRFGKLFALRYDDKEKKIKGCFYRAT